MALTMQSPSVTGTMASMLPPGSPSLGSTGRGLESREKRTFKDKLMTMVQEAEAQEQLAMREAQSQDKKSLAISILLEGRPQAFVDFFNLTHGGAAGPAGTAQGEAASSSGRLDDDSDLPQESLLLLKAQLIKADVSKREGRSMDVYQAYKVLATYFSKLGKLRNAEFFFKQALAVAKATGWVQGEMEANLSLGTVYEELQVRGKGQEQGHMMWKGFPSGLRSCWWRAEST